MNMYYMVAEVIKSKRNYGGLLYRLSLLEKDVTKVLRGYDDIPLHVVDILDEVRDIISAYKKLKR